MFSRLVLLDGLTSAEDNRLWINIARTGEWNGHPRGPFKFTPEVFDQIIANASQRQTPINCDYEHQTFKSGIRGAVPSSGHILKLERRGDSLWAYVQLTPQAAQHVRAGEYRSCSPVIEFDATDRATGEEIGPEMLSLALTNDPFQDGLVPYALTRSDAMAEPVDEKKKDEDVKELSGTGGEKSPADHAADASSAAAAAAQAASAAHAAAGGAGGGQATALADPEVAGEAAAAAVQAVEADSEEVDANSVFEALADASNIGKAEVLATIADNLDAFVNFLQSRAGKTDGNPSEGKVAATAMSADYSGEIRALRVELKQSSTTVKALSSRLEATENELKQVREKAAKEKADAIKTHVLSLQKEGKVGPEAQDVEDAVFMFSQNWDRAARAYRNQIVPVGKPDSEDERNPKAATGPVTLDNLSERELRSVEFMVQGGIVRDKALQIVGERRAAGKGN